MPHAKRAVRSVLIPHSASNEAYEYFEFRRWNGQIATYDARDTLSAPMSDETRAMMEKLLFDASTKRGEWIEYA